MIKAASDQNARTGIGPIEPPPNQKRKDFVGDRNGAGVGDDLGKTLHDAHRTQRHDKRWDLEEDHREPVHEADPGTEQDADQRREHKVIVPREKHGGDQRRDRHYRRNRKVDLAGAQN